MAEKDSARWSRRYLRTAFIAGLVGVLVLVGWVLIFKPRTPEHASPAAKNSTPSGSTAAGSSLPPLPPDVPLQMAVVIGNGRQSVALMSASDGKILRTLDVYPRVDGVEHGGMQATKDGLALFAGFRAPGRCGQIVKVDLQTFTVADLELEGWVPGVSWDGGQLAYAEMKRVGPTEYSFSCSAVGIAVLDLKTGETKRWPFAREEQDVVVGPLNWSPNGKDITFLLGKGAHGAYQLRTLDRTKRGTLEDASTPFGPPTGPGSERWLDQEYLSDGRLVVAMDPLDEDGSPRGESKILLVDPRGNATTLRQFPHLAPEIEFDPSERFYVWATSITNPGPTPGYVSIVSRVRREDSEEVELSRRLLVGGFSW